jgi:hypothetical protein
MPTVLCCSETQILKDKDKYSNTAAEMKFLRKTTKYALTTEGIKV